MADIKFFYKGSEVTTKQLDEIIKKHRHSDDSDLFKSTITITFSESVENHVGMQIIGKKCEQGFTCDDLHNYEKIFQKDGLTCEYHDLVPYLKKPLKIEGSAAILIVRNFLDGFTDTDKNSMYNELNSLNWDTKAFIRGKVVNKKARYNLCFADEDQSACYEEGKGTVVSFKKLHHLSDCRDILHKKLGGKAENLYAEGNLYYDTKECYIGFHGDAERKKVIALRLGASYPLFYKWFHRSESVSETVRLDINHGDLYIMSEIATGNNWKKQIIPTLRHAAGEKALTIK